MLIKRVVLLFWASYFTLVFITDLTDGLKAVGLFPNRLRFASGNYEFMVEVTSIYGTPEWIVALCFIAVILWAGTATFAFWRSVRAFKGMKRAGAETAYQAFAWGTGLWAAFLVLDEFFLVYLTTDLPGVHIRLFIASLVSLLAVVLLPEEWPTAQQPAH